MTNHYHSFIRHSSFMYHTCYALFRTEFIITGVQKQLPKLINEFTTAADRYVLCMGGATVMTTWIRILAISLSSCIKLRQSFGPLASRITLWHTTASGVRILLIASVFHVYARYSFILIRIHLGKDSSCRTCVKRRDCYLALKLHIRAAVFATTTLPHVD